MNTIVISLNMNTSKIQLSSYVKYLLKDSKVLYNHVLIFLPDSEVNLQEFLEPISLISTDKEITILGALEKAQKNRNYSQASSLFGYSEKDHKAMTKVEQF